MKRGPVYAILLALLLGMLMLAGLKHVFVLREISVEGNDGIPAEKAIAASGLEPGASMFRLNTGMVKDGISSLGSHALAEMRYDWPDGVILKLRRRTPIAMACCGDGIAILDGEGIVTELAEDVPDRDLAYISGVHPESAALGKLFPMGSGADKCKTLLDSLLQADALSYVSEIDLSAQRDARIILRTGCVAELDMDGSLPEKMAWMRDVVRDMERRGETGGLLRITDAGHADLVLPENMAE